jgi:transposase
MDSDTLSIVKHICRRGTNLLTLESSLWTFTRVPGIAAENNAAERPLRRAVLRRKKSFGTQSKTGSQFVERILTVITTLRQQGRDVLDYLSRVCSSAAHDGEGLINQAPDLLRPG